MLGTMLCIPRRLRNGILHYDLVMATPTWLPMAIPSAGIILSMTAFAWQVHRARFNQSVDLLFKLEGDFFGDRKEKQRALSAKNNLKNAADYAEMEDLLDFFETVAMLTRKKALNLYMVWHTFNYWIEHYYQIARPHIQASQAFDPGRWEDLDWLMTQLVRQAKKTGARALVLDDAERLRFLTEEASEG